MLSLNITEVKEQKVMSTRMFRRKQSIQVPNDIKINEKADIIEQNKLLDIERNRAGPIGVPKRPTGAKGRKLPTSAIQAQANAREVLPAALPLEVAPTKTRGTKM